MSAVVIDQYFKLERALRTETTFNDTKDFRIGRSLGNLPRLKALGRNINRRLLTLERVAHNCAIASKTVERIVLPTSDEQGHRIPALRWGQPRTMALMSALCAFTAAPEGLTNRTLRPRVASLHDPDYSASQMSYDLRRLRLNALIARVPHTHRYVLTPLGRRVAFFLCKSYCRIVRPALHRTDPALPDDSSDRLRSAWRNCEREIHTLIAEAKMTVLCGRYRAYR